MEDYTCNFLGNERWVSALPWAGAREWARTPARPWAVPDSIVPAGTVRSVEGLTFLTVTDAGCDACNSVTVRGGHACWPTWLHAPDLQTDGSPVHTGTWFLWISQRPQLQ